MKTSKFELFKVLRWCNVIGIIATLATTINAGENDLACKNENNQNVDFYVIYKPPSSKNYYVKYDQGGLQKGKQLITARESALGRTLQPIFNDDDPSEYVVWNDDKAADDNENGVTDADNFDKSPSASFGHSKGILAFNFVRGFLIIHTISKLGDGATYHFSDKEFGFAQMAVCVSITGNQQELFGILNDILDKLETFKPQVLKVEVSENYDHNVRKKLSHLGQGRLDTPHEPIVSEMDLNKHFKAHFFSRHEKREKATDTRYDAFHTLAKFYKTSLTVQSWSQGDGGWKSQCDADGFQEENVLKVRVAEEPAWATKQDHSKWAVGKELQVVCIGDLNRHAGTMARGGMMLCTKDKELHNVFSRFANELERCPSFD